VSSELNVIWEKAPLFVIPRNLARRVAWVQWFCRSYSATWNDV